MKYSYLKPSQLALTGVASSLFLSTSALANCSEGLTGCLSALALDHKLCIFIKNLWKGVEQRGENSD